MGFEDVGLLSRLLVTIPLLPLQWRRPAEDIPFHVFNKSQSVRVTIAAMVKVARIETVAAATEARTVSRGIY
jgi:hypothetical protein